MNFQQLRILRETRRQNFNLTEVALALAASQSGVSKHIKDLEDELGVNLFVRRGKRLLGLTEPGSQILGFVEKILTDVDNIRSVANQLAKADEGAFVIATTHTQARYALPDVIMRFKIEFPNVQLVLHQTNPTEIAAMLRAGRADIGIATESIAADNDLAAFPYYSWRHIVLVPKNHPLEQAADLTLEELARYNIITYHEGFTGRSIIDRAFERAGLDVQIVMSAVDSDVIKAYVELGLGVGIVASVAYHPERDVRLSRAPCAPLFEPTTSYMALWRGRFLRDYVYRFIAMCRPELTEKVVRRSLDIGSVEDYSI